MKGLISGVMALLASTSQLASAADQIDCRSFRINLYDGNVGAQLYVGNVYGYDIYQFTDNSLEDTNQVTETYKKIMSNIIDAPDQFTISYSISDIKNSPNDFEVKNSRYSGTSFRCKVI